MGGHGYGDAGERAGDFSSPSFFSRRTAQRAGAGLGDRSAEKGFTAEISYWRSLQSRDPTEEILHAYKWLLFGRGSYGKGASEAFRAIPHAYSGGLRFFDVEAGTKLGRRRGKSSRPAGSFRISRSAWRRSLLAKKADWKRSRRRPRSELRRTRHTYMTAGGFDEAYLKQAQGPVRHLAWFWCFFLASPAPEVTPFADVHLTIGSDARERIRSNW